MKFENVQMVLPGRQIRTGNLEFDGGRITAIELTEGRGGGLLVMPGLINAHGHTAMTLVRGLGGGLPLQRWLNEAIFPVEAKMTPEDIAAGVKWGALEMLAGGTTCVADMYDFPDRGEAAFAEIGFKANTSRVGLNFVPGRLDECVAFTRAPAAPLQCRDLCIHSEYLTDEPFCRALAEANRELKRPVHFHCSETRKEHEECLKRHGKTPIAYLADTGLLDFGGYAAHCVWCTDDDFRIMASKRVTLVHNPTSNLKLGSGFARVPRAMALGVNVALGTDGCASNDNLDLFEEMHLASLIHKGIACDPTVLSPWDIIEMATVNGAKALGRDAGELRVGAAADFCVIELGRLHLTPALEIANLIVNSMHASDVVETWVNGVKRYDRGSFAALDFARVKADFAAAVNRLFPELQNQSSISNRGFRAFVVAMECEAAAVKDAMRSGDRLYLSGIGKVNAAAAAQRAIDEGATEIVNVGLCGGFGEHVEVGGVYEVSAAVEYDFDLAQLNGTRVGQLEECDTPFLTGVTSGKLPAKILATGDHFNDSTADYTLIEKELGAELRDMEGAAIVHVCHKRGLPCRLIKCVTNVSREGSMTGQYQTHKQSALKRLTATLEQIL